MANPVCSLLFQTHYGQANKQTNHISSGKQTKQTKFLPHALPIMLSLLMQESICHGLQGALLEVGGRDFTVMSDSTCLSVSLSLCVSPMRGYSGSY